MVTGIINMKMSLCVVSIFITAQYQNPYFCTSLTLKFGYLHPTWINRSI